MKTQQRTGLLLMLMVALYVVPAHASVRLESQVYKVQRQLQPDGSVREQLLPAEQVVPGDELRYHISVHNQGDAAVDANSIVITDPLPPELIYLPSLTQAPDSRVTYSVDGEQFATADALFVQRNGERVLAQPGDYRAIRFEYAPALAPGEQASVSFAVRLR